jgi:hypothetical protein
MIIPLKNPEALSLQPIRDLFARAFEHGRPVGSDVFLAAIAPYLTDPRVAVLLGREDDAYKALAVVFLPSSPLFPLPQVYHFYNRGSVKLRNTLTDAVVEWVKSQGYNGLHVVNWTAGSDKAWTRAFQRAGRVERIGTAFRIDF